MPIGSLKDLYIDELGDLYDAETQMIRLLPRLAESARAPELREALTRHCDESRLHLERLDLIFTHWGERRRTRPCAGLAGIVQEADDRLIQQATDDARDAAIIGVAQRIEHYEIAAYGCARTYARRLNRPDEARLLQETLDDEARADRRLTEMAEAHINDDARTEEDLAELPRPTGRLRFVAADDRRGRRRLSVRTDADADIGTFDGVVVDTDAGRPRYAVIDSGGVFVHRRYLMPLDALRLDDQAHVLRSNIDKDVASRYPPFDPDEFESMAPWALRGFEERLLDVFRRERTTRDAQTDSSGAPEWLLTGTWITVPDDQSARLNEGTRPFANEFIPNREQLVARDPDATVPFTVDPDATRSFTPDELPQPPRRDKTR